MSKPILYGTPLCPDCPPMVEYLDSKGFGYEYVDITASIADLKAFLKLRDSRKEFDPMRENGSIGIPVLVMDGKVYFSEEIQELIK
ncbi:MAG: glutaredoxin domain-containing protein [Peptostreptococcaceae bacterium]|nr:glutaredoxin domain-containing protein [Peptostreptococcaceae bacterium]